MNIVDPVVFKGRVQIYSGDTLVRDIDNLVVTTGKTYIASILGGASAYAGTYMGLGIGTTSAGIWDTDLQTPKGTRVNGTLSTVGSAFVVDSTFPQNNPTTQEFITEAALFTASTSGTMVARTTFAGVTKPVTDTLRIVWTITVA